MVLNVGDRVQGTGDARLAMKGALGRQRHLWEVLAVVGGFTALTLALTYPVVREMTRALPSDLGDPLLNAWTLAWDADRLAHGLQGFWDAPIFYPYRNTLAYSEHLLGIAVLTAPRALERLRPLLLRAAGRRDHRIRASPHRSTTGPVARGHRVVQRRRRLLSGRVPCPHAVGRHVLVGRAGDRPISGADRPDRRLRLVDPRAIDLGALAGIHIASAVVSGGRTPRNFHHEPLV